MPSLDLILLRWWFVMVAAGAAVAVALFLGFYLDARRRREPAPEEHFEEYPADIRIGKGPMPMLLILLYVSIALFIIAYVTFVVVGRVTY